MASKAVIINPRKKADLVNRINGSDLYRMDGNYVHLKAPPDIFPTISHRLFPLVRDLPLDVGALVEFDKSKQSMPLGRIDEDRVVLLNGDYPAVREHHKRLIGLALEYSTFWDY